jgi:GDPmannose 4,6-dehydratase
MKIPQDENTYHYPRSPYGCSKSFGYNITRNYRESYGIFACNGILFNHESERRGMQFVTRKITRTIAEIKMGLSKNLTVGNLDSKRDWGYAPDYVEAMWLILQHKNPDDYIIASGEEHSVREFIDHAFKNIDIDITWEGAELNEKGFNKKNGDLLVKVSKKFFRPAEVDLLRGDASKARNTLGWKPKISFEEMITKMVNFDISELKKS